MSGTTSLKSRKTFTKREKASKKPISMDEHTLEDVLDHRAKLINFGVELKRKREYEKQSLFLGHL
jgi:hypothetical protein